MQAALVVAYTAEPLVDIPVVKWMIARQVRFGANERRAALIRGRLQQPDRIADHRAEAGVAVLRQRPHPRPLRLAVHLTPDSLQPGVGGIFQNPVAAVVLAP